MRSAGRIVVLAAASIGLGISGAYAVVDRDDIEPPKRRVSRHRRISTSKYMPHQGDGEILRRARQAHKLNVKYMMNGGFSRRGREVGPLGE